MAIEKKDLVDCKLIGSLQSWWESMLQSIRWTPTRTGHLGASNLDLNSSNRQWMMAAGLISSSNPNQEDWC